MKNRVDPRRRLLGPVVSAAVYICAWLLALVVGLATWSQYHLALSNFGGIQPAFLGTVTTAGFIFFAAAAVFLGWLGRFRWGADRHLHRSWILYLLALWALTASFVSWPAAGEHIEGWNITVSVAALLALLGIGMDLAMGFCGRHLNNTWILFLGAAMAIAAAMIGFLLAVTNSTPPSIGVFQPRSPGAVHLQAPGAESLARARAITALDWEGADAQTLRLAPSEFPSLPNEVRAELERRGCTVPQPYGQGAPVNVIHGEFVTAGERDIAVLCSRDRKSSILVFRGGRADSVSELEAPQPDKSYLMHQGNNQIGFTRDIHVAGPALIETYQARYQRQDVPKPYHDGIGEGFHEVASVIWYWHHGRWLQLPGAD